MIAVRHRPRGSSLERAVLVDGEAPPTMGDVLVLAPSFASPAVMMAVRVEHVDGRTVWFECVNVNRGPLGAERWQFLPPVRRRGPERLGRRR